jgi:SAM-dependent MidA family methyltransferase
MRAARQTPLAAKLAGRMRTEGPILFAEYMRACLYDPEFGYYQQAISPRADYYTNVDVHPVFGALIAQQCREMWRLLGAPAPMYLVEFGAGSGQLAAHVLDHTQRELPEFYSSLKYVAVEAGTARRNAAERTLARHIEVGQCTLATELGLAIENGIILSNEFLDALPVHRVAQFGGRLHEICVDHAPDGFREVLGELLDSSIAEYFASQEIVLAEGQEAEAGMDASAWIERAGRALHRGFVLSIDYGHEAAELYDQRHMRGTLLAYENHRCSEDFYGAPGEQDLTAHVNFTALRNSGLRAGLEWAGMVTQAHFLLALARADEFYVLEPPGATESQRAKLRLLFKTLIYPEGMGEVFQVAIQHKGFAEPPVLAGLAPL